MSTVTTKDGTRIFFKDWGLKTAQPIMFHHGWPLSSDDWDAQMLFFLGKGYRVVAHDRRGHGRTPDVEGPITFDAMAQDTIAFLETVVGRPAHVVGCSDGATVALLVALRRPGADQPPGARRGRVSFRRVGFRGDRPRRRAARVPGKTLRRGVSGPVPGIIR